MERQNTSGSVLFRYAARNAEELCGRLNSLTRESLGKLAHPWHLPAEI